LKRLVAATSLLVVLASGAIAQSKAAPKEFDVATIKPSAVDNGDFAVRALPGGTLSCTGVTLKMLIMEAYEVKAFQISGGPSWVGTARWDLEARVEDVQGRLSPAQERLMLRALLEDRFQLKVRSETKEMPVFALVVAAAGSKLTTHVGEAIPFGQRFRLGLGLYSVKQGNIARLVTELTRQLWRPVIDKTDLKGEYDFTLEWTPQPGQGGSESLGLPPQPLESAPPVNPDGPTIFSALQEQLGLRLDSQKGPVGLIVIEGVEKPSAN
jgi:uncharacterized protein (TIGR03435 family)